ncbi:hypothetical protein HMPREF9444_01860 [Succinatimonas hippei YIT 12066]|uniref:Uncharacterized protein n=1 Tax=Succinatimonas hippei (strain DSM 22608 / JCM 16073 / KCTC 15190 / YIT 12066) TaxID=762983 RepID=E8LM75_SUCHY|nr:hypothetical protein HMPREF9444_01860 [Succinatimonas hippei YIT 12066]
MLTAKTYSRNTKKQENTISLIMILAPDDLYKYHRAAKKIFNLK